MKKIGLRKRRSKRQRGKRKHFIFVGCYLFAVHVCMKDESKKRIKHDNATMWKQKRSLRKCCRTRLYFLFSVYPSVVRFVVLLLFIIYFTFYCPVVEQPFTSAVNAFFIWFFVYLCMSVYVYVWCFVSVQIPLEDNLHLFLLDGSACLHCVHMRVCVCRLWKSAHTHARTYTDKTVIPFGSSEWWITLAARSFRWQELRLENK